MARALSDDPEKLERELAGLLKRAHAIQIKLLSIEARNKPADVTPIGELGKRVEDMKRLAMGEATLEELGYVEALDDAEMVDF